MVWIAADADAHRDDREARDATFGLQEEDQATGLAEAEVRYSQPFSKLQGLARHVLGKDHAVERLLVDPPGKMGEGWSLMAQRFRNIKLTCADDLFNLHLLHQVWKESSPLETWPFENLPLAKFQAYSNRGVWWKHVQQGILRSEHSVS